MAERQDAAAPGSPAAVAELLRSRAYLADRGLATAVYLGLTLDQPLLLEGEAGVGKTEVARTLADALGRCLVRLQCYEGIDASQALYEWDYPRQLLHLRAVAPTLGSVLKDRDDLFRVQAGLEELLAHGAR
jgi:MoxR-like ATPase